MVRATAKTVEKNDMQDKKFLATATALFLGYLALFSGALHAAEGNGWYVGGGVGKNHPITNPADSLNVTHTDVVGRFFFGYQPVGFIALEGGYVDFNRFVSLNSSSQETTTELAGYNLRLILSVPLSRDNRASSDVWVFVSSGAYKWDSKESVVNSSGTTVSDTLYHDRDKVVGAGLWLRRRNASTRIDYEIYDSIRNVDLKALTLSVIYYY